MADSDSEYDEEAELRLAIQMSLEEAANDVEPVKEADKEANAENVSNDIKAEENADDTENEEITEEADENEEGQVKTEEEKPKEGDWVWTKLGYGVVESCTEDDGGEECVSVKLKHGPPETCKLEEVKKTISLEIRSFAQIPKVVDRPKPVEPENLRQKSRAGGADSHMFPRPRVGGADSPSGRGRGRRGQFRNLMRIMLAQEASGDGDSAMDLLETLFAHERLARDRINADSSADDGDDVNDAPPPAAPALSRSQQGEGLSGSSFRELASFRESPLGFIRQAGPPGANGRNPDELIMGLSQFFREQSVPRPSRSDFSPGPWQCNRCTFINQQSGVERCEMCGLVRPPPPKRTTHEGWVVHEVHSGNKLVLRNPETGEKKHCVLSGLNAPVVAYAEGDKEDNFGHASRECLRLLTVGQTVQHVSFEKQGPPMPGSSADEDPEKVEIVLEDGDCGEMMVQRGYCRCNGKGSAKYGESERRARAAKVGMWQDNVNDDEHTRKITWSIEDDLAGFTAAHQDPAPAILESVMDVSLFTAMLSLGNNNFQLLMFELAGIEMLGDDDSFGEECQKYVENNWLNRSIIIRCVDVSPNDIITVELKTADGSDVYLACELLKRGFARIVEDNVAGIDNQVLELMQEAQHEAVENQLHIWAQEASEEAEDDKNDEDDQKMEQDEEKQDEDEDNDIDSAVPELGMESSDEDDVEEEEEPAVAAEELPAMSEESDKSHQSNDEPEPAPPANPDDSDLSETLPFQPFPLARNPPAPIPGPGDFPPIQPSMPPRSGASGDVNLPPDLQAPRLSRSGQARLRAVNLRRTELARKVAELRAESKEALGRFVMKMNGRDRENLDSGPKKKEKKSKLRISDYTPPSKIVPMKVEHNGVLSFDAPVTETLESIRDKIVEKFKVSKDAVRLLHRGKELTEWHKSIAELNVHAPEELFFIIHEDSSVTRFDSSRCGDSMKISDDGTKATCLTHNQWYVAIGNKCVHHGRHSWTFRVDKIGKPGFIGFGVCQETASLTTWLGNGANSCGILGDGVRWAKGSRHPSVRSQIFFREGDLVTIDLDMDARMMTILRNGSSIPHSSFVDLPDALFPAVSLYEKGDSVTLVDQNYNLPSKIRIFRSIKSLKLVLECTRKACEPFNLFPGDQVMLANEKQTGTVIGASLLPTQGVVYIHVPGRDGLLGHNRPSCNKHVKIYRRANARLSLQTRIRPAVEDPLCYWGAEDEDKSASIIRSRWQSEQPRLPPR